MSVRRCSNCGELGHYRQTCTNQPAIGPRRTYPVKCTVCAGLGHRRADCPRVAERRARRAVRPAIVGPGVTGGPLLAGYRK